MNKSSLILIFCFFYSCVNPITNKTNNVKSSSITIKAQTKKIKEDDVQLYSLANSADVSSEPKIPFAFNKHTLVTPIIEIKSFDDDSLFIKEIKIHIKRISLKRFSAF